MKEQRVACEDCQDHLPDLSDGKRDCEILVILREQVEKREACVECFGAYRRTAELCRKALDQVPTPKDLSNRLMSFLRAKLEES